MCVRKTDPINSRTVCFTKWLSCGSSLMGEMTSPLSPLPPPVQPGHLHILLSGYRLWRSPPIRSPHWPFTQLLPLCIPSLLFSHHANWGVEIERQWVTLGIRESLAHRESPPRTSPLFTVSYFGFIVDGWFSFLFIDAGMYVLSTRVKWAHQNTFWV